MGLLVIAGVVLWSVRRRNMRKHAGLLDMTGTMTELTPFEEHPATVTSPVGYVSKQQRREMERRGNVLLLPSTPFTVVGDGDSSAVQSGTSPTHTTSYLPRQDGLVWLRTDSEVEGFRRFMQNVHVGRLAEDDEAPPEYS